MECHLMVIFYKNSVPVSSKVYMAFTQAMLDVEEYDAVEIILLNQTPEIFSSNNRIDPISGTTAIPVDTGLNMFYSPTASSNEVPTEC